jgi:predicted metalloprotease
LKTVVECRLARWEKARGYSQPETFTHGTSKQRMKWLKLGLTTGDMTKGNTFECSDAEL